MSILIFILGLIIGSFLNCLIYRLEISEQGWLKKMILGRSFCPHCHHTLAWYDLIPVLSFIFLKGRCRYCKKSISWQYPIVEIVTGLLFLLIFNFSAFAQGFGGLHPFGVSQFLIFNQFSIFNYQTLTQFVCSLFIVSCLIVIFVFDLKHYLIPDEIVYSAIGVTFIYRLFKVLSIGHWNLIGNWKLEIGNFEPLLNSFTSAILAGVFFLVIYLVTKGKGMGFGDVKLAFLMGLFLGFPNILVALFFAFLSGAIIGLFLMIFRGKTLKSELPFGPFLISSTFFALFFGQAIVDCYLGFLSF